MGKSFLGDKLLDVENDKCKNDKSHLKTNIPIFRVGGNNIRPQKTFLISYSCKNSET